MEDSSFQLNQEQLTQQVIIMLEKKTFYNSGSKYVYICLYMCFYDFRILSKQSDKLVILWTSNTPNLLLSLFIADQLSCLWLNCFHGISYNIDILTKSYKAKLQYTKIREENIKILSMRNNPLHRCFLVLLI